MSAVQAYLRGLARIHSTGEAVEETSYYGQLEALLNAVGAQISPKVLCVLTTRNRGAGLPDGGLFLVSSAVQSAGRNILQMRAPERGVVEVKGPGREVRQVARTQQIRRYLTRYGKVLVTNYREFLVVSLGGDGAPVFGEFFSLAPTEADFWQLAGSWASLDEGVEDAASRFLERALLGDAPISQPADLAAFLAAYAREGRRRLENVNEGSSESLSLLRGALEDSLGLHFEGEEGESFFRAALVQTLFYGVFAAWVVWCESQPQDSRERFRWQTAQWTLNVPMVRVLFQQLATRSVLPVGLDEVLDWTEDVLARVDRGLFFESFESGSAVQYFYEPFLQAYDPELRRQLGVWYTPPEVVRYMVARVHRALQSDLGLELGLADESVHILDPCTGTGSYLVETLETIARVLEDHHGDALVAQDAKRAALTRVHGFEVLPAPFVIAHLNVGLALERLGAPLDDRGNERAQVYLTNALTGWGQESGDHELPFPEFEAEREAADHVKRSQPILVVIGNPPYNGFAGVSGREEGNLLDPYKAGLSERWDITKNKLDDLYVRFFRVAERRVAEMSGRGVVCFISNFSWLGDPSAVVMRERLVGQFDRIYIDNLNGDSRETGKKTPEGLADPSVFSTRLAPAGIQVGTAISLLVRTESREAGDFQGWYRDFWGPSKRADLVATMADNGSMLGPEYRELRPSTDNWFRLREWSPRLGYERWPTITELAANDPYLGLNENRGEGLVGYEKSTVEHRLQIFLNSDIEFVDLEGQVAGLTQPWSGFNASRVRRRMLLESPFDAEKVVPFTVKPFDVRWAYVDTTSGLWNRSRPELVEASRLGSDFLVLRRRAPRALDGAAFLVARDLIDQHVLHKDAYAIPFVLSSRSRCSTPYDLEGLFEFETPPEAQPWVPNLSEAALNYLNELGISDAMRSRQSAQLLWQHVLAIGYSPLYLEENGDAIRSDWPKVPLPTSARDLIRSAELGGRLADLLDLRTPLGSQLRHPEFIRSLAQIRSVDGRPPGSRSSDFRMTAGWATEQLREQRSGAVSRIVMPGAGRIKFRVRTAAERDALPPDGAETFGDEVVDVYLNEEVCWSNVPEAAWDFKIGGFQVLRKWLSYRDERIIGRGLSVDEVRQFSAIVRRLSEMVLLNAALDANYLRAAGVDLNEGLALVDGVG